MTYQDTPLAEITVPENRLRELRDYSGLAASMDEVGLLQPITVTEAGTLVAGRHRLEAAKSLGWSEIPAFVVEDDALANRLAEIDENLRRLDLTVYEQSKHAEERERVLEAMGQRNKVGGDRRSEESSAHRERMKSTNDIADEAGMSEASWKRRTKIGRGLGDKTRAALDNADPSEDKHRNFLNSTSQLDHLANISEKRGDNQAAQTAERVLNGEHKTTFDAYPEVKGQRREPEPTVREAIEDDEGESLKLPPFDISAERKAYKSMVVAAKDMGKLDWEKVVSECKGPDDAERQARALRKIKEWAAEGEAAFEAKGKEYRYGNFEVVK